MTFGVSWHDCKIEGFSRRDDSVEWRWQDSAEELRVVELDWGTTWGQFQPPRWRLYSKIYIYAIDKYTEKNISDDHVLNESICSSASFLSSMALCRTSRLCLCASLNHSSELLIPINLVLEL